VTSAIALIPARAGSQRVLGKNTRQLKGHPLIAYSIAGALDSNEFDRVLVSTDSEETAEIALHYGAEVPELRPAKLAGSKSPDIEWVKYTLEKFAQGHDVFSILRPTSPFRSADTIKRAFIEFKAANCDSIRAVELCKEHPGKMWSIEGDRLLPLLEQPEREIPWHSRQYQDLPKVYVQNSSLEIAWTRTVLEMNSIAGTEIAPFLTNQLEGFSIDYEHDWIAAEYFEQENSRLLPEVRRFAFFGASTNS
jgi:CMP-N,N'-diacetyllegionaminic acid synthase